MAILRNLILHKPFLFFGAAFISLGFNANSQDFPAKNYPKGYFQYPVGAKVGLAANFGELRPNHYHMGLDCKTDQRQNVNVYAAADGYVAKVKIEPSGFGRAIYIAHPNGYTTLYAHLNDFFPQLEKYVKEQQYMQESWQVFLDIPKGLIPVTKGQFIAYSGNTGGSQGPHTHFEIRDTETDKVYNPSLFGFPIPDDVPPSILRLAVYDRCKSTYSQSPRIIGLKKTAGGYTTSTPLIVLNTESVSFGISAIDKYTGSANPNGIYQAVLYFDEEPVVGFQLDDISYDETRYLNAHIDHRTRAAGGPFIEHLSRLPGYPEGVYTDFSGDGVIDIEDDSAHHVRIEVKDANGNTSNLKFDVKRSLAAIKKSKEETSLSPLLFKPGFVNIFEREDVQVVLKEEDLYDSINFVYSKKVSPSPLAVSAIHSIHTGLIPVQGYYTVRIKPTVEIDATKSDHVIMQRCWGPKTNVVKAKREGEWYTGQFRAFGNVQLLVDESPPVITPVGIRDNADLSRSARIVFVVSDNNDEFKNFRAELDGKWLRFTNDKGRSFIYTFDEMCQPGEHELKVSVEDEAGNVAERVYHFKR